jgi:hypothetical protein
MGANNENNMVIVEPLHGMQMPFGDQAVPRGLPFQDVMDGSPLGASAPSPARGATVDAPMSPAAAVYVPEPPATVTPGWNRELYAHPEFAKDVFLNLHLALLKCVSVASTLRKDGSAWEVNERAYYDVTLTNSTGCDLRDVCATLGATANAKILTGETAARLSFGNIPNGMSVTKTWNLQATGAGGWVSLLITLDGLVGSCSARLWDPPWRLVWYPPNYIQVPATDETIQGD